MNDMPPLDTGTPPMEPVEGPGITYSLDQHAFVMADYLEHRDLELKRRTETMRVAVVRAQAAVAAPV